MTKAEKAIIITREADLWLDLKREQWGCACKLSKDEFPNWCAFLDWANDHCQSVRDALQAWNAVYVLLKSLKLEPDYQNEQHEIARIYSDNVYEYFEK